MARYKEMRRARLTCKHKWIHRKYKGLEIEAEWDECIYCGKDKNRQVRKR